jgi:hypothetical protein
MTSQSLNTCFNCRSSLSIATMIPILIPFYFYSSYSSSSHAL